MRSSTLPLALLLHLTVYAITAVAQVPRILTIPVYLEESGFPVNGQHTLEVSWYTSPVGGTAVLTETVSTLIEQGSATLTLGTSVAITDSVLMLGSLWIGIRIDGGPELLPRTMLASVPYAMIADRARIAEELAPEVTGIVTSLNEIAGAVRLVGGRGSVVRRDGNTLTLEIDRLIESGEVTPTAGAHEFVITPLVVLEPDVIIKVAIDADTHISADVVLVDPVANTFTIRCAAPLLPTEHIRWQLWR